MPRKPIVRSNQNYYHITARSNNKEFFYLSIDEIWRVMTDKLAKLQCLYQIKIAAFVLMNNHFHLLVLTPSEDIDRIMYFFMKDVTLEIQKKTGRVNKIFGGRYKGSMITSYGYLVNVYKYICRNPVEVKMVEQAEDYAYSTLCYKNDRDLVAPFKIESIFPSHAFEKYENLDECKWINQKYDQREASSIKCGLLKTTFAYEKDKVNNRPIEPAIKHPKKKTQELLGEGNFLS